MTFDEILTQVLTLLQREGRVSYRALKRRFDLDEDYLEDLKAEIIQAKKLAVDEDGDVLVWTGNAAPAPALVSDQERAPLSYTPAYLAEKILTSRAALEGERKQVTVQPFPSSLQAQCSRGQRHWPFVNLDAKIPPDVKVLIFS